MRRGEANRDKAYQIVIIWGEYTGRTDIPTELQLTDLLITQTRVPWPHHPRWFDFKYLIRIIKRKFVGPSPCFNSNVSIG